MSLEGILRLHPAWNFVADPHGAEMWDLRDGTRIRITAPRGLPEFLRLLRDGVSHSAWNDAVQGVGMTGEDARVLLDSMADRGMVDTLDRPVEAPATKNGVGPRDRGDPLRSFFEHYSGPGGSGAQLFEWLRSATVVVFGLGGSGTWVVQTLAMLGVGRIRGIDSDVVESSNLGRQAFYRPADLGRPKALVVQEQLSALNPDVRFEPLVTRIETERDFDDTITDVDLVALPFAYMGRHPSRDLAARVCVARGVAFLPFGLRAVGPLWMPGSNPCYRCVLPDPRTEALLAVSRSEATAQIDELPYLPWLAASANRAADEIVRALTGFLAPLTLGHVLSADSQGGVERRSGHRRPDCPVCGAAGSGGTDVA
jgi:bacteriocin biosynthesis cyclodehydratase domain-containing protein